MKENIEYLKDLRDVKHLMERSTKFISLSGLSGVMAGLYALICAYLVYKNLYVYEDYSISYKILKDEFSIRIMLVTYGSITIFLALTTGFFLSWRKAKKENQNMFGKVAFQLLYNLAIPLVIGGLTCLLVLYHGGIGYIGSLTLIFYGLALINASQFTYTDIKGLGLLECFIGLLSLYFIGYSLLFWALGFGVAHIVYGVIMYWKYERK